MTVLVVALVALLAAIVGFVVSGQIGMLATFVARPFMDSVWNKDLFVGLNVGQIAGGILPFLMLVRLLMGRHRLVDLPLGRIWIAYLLSNLVPAALALGKFGVVPAADMFLRILSGFVGYFMLQVHFRERDRFKTLLQVIIVAGVFPIAVGIYQAATGVVWREHMTVGLQRNQGLFHDIVTMRIYVFQTMTGMLLYWAYFRKSIGKVTRLLMIALGVACAAVLFKTYSKAGYMIALAWVLIWGIYRRQMLVTGVVVGILLLGGSLFYDRLWDDAEQLFSKESAALEDREGLSVEDPTFKRTLGGRWYLWSAFIEEFSERDLPAQIFGDGKLRSAHNDFLGVLQTGGVLGVIIYTALLVAAGRGVWARLRQHRSPINVMASMLFAMWLIDATGLVPRLYPGYQWYVWGFIGLALRGLPWDQPNQEPGSAQRSDRSIGPARRRPRVNWVGLQGRS